MVLVLVVMGCKTPKPIINTSFHLREETEVLRDTTINVPIKEMSAERFTTDTLSILKTDNASSTASIINGVLHHTLEQFGVQATPITIKDKFVSDTKEDKKEIPVVVKEIEKVEVEKELNWFQKTFLYLGYLTGLVIVVYLLIRVIKRYLKIK